MKSAVTLFFTLLLSFQIPSFSQQNDSLQSKIDSASFIIDSTVSKILIDKDVIPESNITGSSYFKLLGKDLKQTFNKPFHMHKRDWWRLAKFSLFTGAMMFADEPIQRNAYRFANQHKVVRDVSNVVTSFGGRAEIVTLSALAFYGVAFKNDKLLNTTLLATQACITGGAVKTIAKYLAGRTRPSLYINGVEPEAKFLGPFSRKARDGTDKDLYISFPSGHTTLAFAAAAVFAKQYSNKPIVPVIAYSVATLVGISRVIENKHWTTDVIAGAALGYLTGSLAVKNYLKSDESINKKKKVPLLLDLQYQQGMIMPQLIYKFL